ncbi:MAG: lipoyl synthase [Phycisphaerales bacterium]|nr:lipoyl synthase [Phycisphaerales bacterium]
MSDLLGRDVAISEIKGGLVETLGQSLGFDSVRRAEPRELGQPRKRLPEWLRKKIPAGSKALKVQGLIDNLKLNTVCQSAQCPNRAECFDNRTATFMILGDHCTRSCKFCAVADGTPLPVDPDEPGAVAEAAHRLDLKHVVITSVTRDDLPDGGSQHFADVVQAVRKRMPESTIEILTPDFQNDPDAIDRAVKSGANVFNHNIETVERLQKIVRPQGDYRRSLSVLARAAEHAPTVRIKSGLMVGLGETRTEIRQVMQDLRDAGCEILTIGQYLAPSPDHHPVERFVKPPEFAEMETEAKALGFTAVAASPLVRSSYRAGELIQTETLNGQPDNY